MAWKVPQMENAVRFDNLSDLQSNSKPVQAADSLVLWNCLLEF
jgi:hypothetical protein